MAGTRPWFIALTSAALATGCATQANYPAVPPSNATVARVLMQAPTVVVPSAATSEASVATTAVEVDKTDKRGRGRASTTAQKAKPAARPAVSTAPTATASSSRGTAGAVPQYRYLVELDSGDLRSFDFAVDQKLRAGDRVFVTDGGALSLK